MKRLFTLSPEPLIRILNEMFGTTIAVDKVIDIIHENREFVNKRFRRTIADSIIHVREQGECGFQVEHHFHAEFQLHSDSAMAIRLFEYGWDQAREIANINRTYDRLEFPRQVVLLLEEEANIGEHITCSIMFEGLAEAVIYKVPVKKMWRYSYEELLGKQLYAFLPLLLFQYRKQLDRLHKRRRSAANEKEIERLARRLFRVNAQILRLLDSLLETGKIAPDDMDKVLGATSHLNDYMYGKYKFYSRLEKEVESMITVSFKKGFEEAEERARKAIAEMEEKNKEAVKAAVREAVRKVEKKSREAEKKSREAVALSLLAILSQKGEVSATLKHMIESETDLLKLNQWLLHSVATPTIEQFQEQMELK